jgi:hypothetical protein
MSPAINVIRGGPGFPLDNEGDQATVILLIHHSADHLDHGALLGELRGSQLSLLERAMWRWEEMQESSRLGCSVQDLHEFRDLSLI